MDDERPHPSGLRKKGRLKTWAAMLKRDGLTLWFAVRHPGTPWWAKALALFVVAYALSPIDLIPDFIPVLGYLDDVILLPVLIWLTLRGVPEPVRAECREKAERWLRDGKRRPRSLAGAVLIVALWMTAALAFGAWISGRWGPV